MTHKLMKKKMTQMMKEIKFRKIKTPKEKKRKIK